jgi:hypothetical protein
VELTGSVAAVAALAVGCVAGALEPLGLRPQPTISTAQQLSSEIAFNGSLPTQVSILFFASIMATTPPTETDILCENCGYILNGLPESGNCPECGSPIELSIAQRHRLPPLWEQPAPSALARYLRTTLEIIFRPTRFFRSTTSRGDLPAARRFAEIQWVLTSIMLGIAGWLHYNIYQHVILRSSPGMMNYAILLICPPIVYALIISTQRLAARLTVWEATYRGYRLPHPVVRRALDYHAAHSLPVALMVLLTVASYTGLESTGHLPLSSVLDYLYVLSAEVFVAAIYLFYTYWIAMRNLMYANR